VNAREVKVFYMKIKLFGWAVLFSLAAGTMSAQSAAGVAGISGVVHDLSGAAVPGAKVVISSDARGEVRSITTNGAGLFAAPALVPGTGYKVTVTAAGFAPWEIKDIDLRVGQDLTLTADLNVSQSTTSVEVSGAAPLVDAAKTDVSQVVGTNEIMNLPINGRRVDSFVLNTPGVTSDGTFGLLTFRGVEGNNSFLLDGNDNTQQYYDENGGRTRIVSQISADAVQEFQVVSSNFSAEYGRAMGGVVNTVTKSGTNQYHGTVFYFLRSTGFDARDPFATFSLPTGVVVGINPSEHFLQTGGTVGGPIVKDKLFFFLSADITRRNFPFVDSQIKVGVLDPINQVWVGCGAPATPAQCSAINALLPRFFGTIPRTAKNDLYFGRMDYHLNDKNTFATSFNFLRWISPNGIQTGLSSTVGGGITGNGDDFVTLRNGSASWTYVPNGSIVNNFRYGLYTDREADGYDNAELGGGLGFLDVAVGGVQLGPPTYLPRVQPMETRNQFADDLSWSRGKHLIKFGVDIARTSDYVNSISPRYGSYTYLTPTAFAEDYTNPTMGKNWSAYSQTFGIPAIDYAIKELGFYAEDQWRATDKLTITLGARYEHSIAPTPTLVNPDWPETATIHTGALNLAPRVGIAYRIDKKTVIRGGFGTYFARLLSGMVEDTLEGQGLFQQAVSLTGTNATQLAVGPSLPNTLATAPSGLSGSAISLQFTKPGLKTPYSEQASIALERQFGKDMVLTASGIWSHGVNLYGTTDLNAPLQTTNFTYKVDDANGNQVSTFTTPVYLNPRPNTKYAGVDETTNGVSSWYDALAVTFEKRFSHGFQSLASYTWSHAIDDGQGSSTNAVFTGSTSIWTYNGNYIYDKGSSLIDQRHRFTYTFVWTPTLMRGNSAFAKYVANNWLLSSITTLASGRPVGSETIRLTDTPVTGMLSNSTLNGFGGNTRVPFLPVDGLYTPPVYREDLRLTKMIPLPWEQMKLSVSMEAFNISNTWSPTGETTQAYTEAKGVLTYTPTAFGQGNADGGFPDGTQARRLQFSARFVF
jgi:outer membrane receptor protein involved in Fe transport